MQLGFAGERTGLNAQRSRRDAKHARGESHLFFCVWVPIDCSLLVGGSVEISELVQARPGRASGRVAAQS